MRIRIIKSPTQPIAGVSLDRFLVGRTYNVRRQIACIALAEGWAEVAQEHDSTPNVRPPPSAGAAINGLVIVADDASEMRQLVAEFLPAHGYRVVLTQYGEEPIERLCKQCSDIFVLDVNRDGWPVHPEHVLLTDKTLSVPPVLLRDGATRAGRPTIQAVAVLRKPFDAARLFLAER